MWALGIEFLNEGIEAGLLLQGIEARRAGGLLLERQMHGLVAAILLRMARLDALDGDVEAQPPDGELGEVEQGIGAGERHAVVGADGGRQAALPEQMLEGGDGGVFAGGIERFTEQQVARGMVGDGERGAVLAVAEPELALEFGAPEVVGVGAGRQLGALGTTPRAALVLDQVIAIEHRVDGADRGDFDFAGQAADEQFA